MWKTLKENEKKSNLKIWKNTKNPPCLEVLESIKEDRIKVKNSREKRKIAFHMLNIVPFISLKEFADS